MKVKQQIAKSTNQKLFFGYTLQAANIRLQINGKHI